LRESRLSCPRVARVTSLEELGTMSINNLRGITLDNQAYVGHSISNHDNLLERGLSKLSICAIRYREMKI